MVYSIAQHGADLTLVYPQDKCDEVDSIIHQLEADIRVLTAHSGFPRILPVALSVELGSPQRQADAHISYHNGLDTLLVFFSPLAARHRTINDVDLGLLLPTE
jgi:hypothetical protein